MDICFLAKSFGANRPITAEEIALRISAIESLYSTISSRIDLSKLKSIVIPDDYACGIIQLEDGTKKEFHPTDSKYGTGFAITLHENKSPNRSYCIVVRKELVFPLLPDACLQTIKDNVPDEDYLSLVANRKTAINTIYHEFAHVHENSICDNFEWHESFTTGNSTKAAYLSYCDIMWGEYFACRTSSPSFPMTAEWIVEFSNNIKNIEIDLRKKRKEYNLRNVSLDEFVSYFRERIQLILCKTAYTAGNAFFFRDDEQNQYIKIVAEQLKDCLLLSCWPNFYNALSILYNRFPNWDGPEIFDELCNLIIQYFAEFDIHLSDTPQGIYCSIPVHLDE